MHAARLPTLLLGAVLLALAAVALLAGAYGRHAPVAAAPTAIPTLPALEDIRPASTPIALPTEPLGAFIPMLTPALALLLVGLCAALVLVRRKRRTRMVYTGQSIEMLAAASDPATRATLIRTLRELRASGKLTPGLETKLNTLEREHRG